MNARTLRIAWRVMGWVGVLAVATMSLLPVPEESVRALGGDKFLHAIGYACLGVWFVQLQPDAAGRVRVFAGLVLLGAGLELAQAFAPWRDTELLDVAADAAGAGLGLLLTLGRGGRVLERLARG